MKISRMMRKLSTAALIGLLSSTAIAADQFFEVGKSYLFVPRLDFVMKGTVTQITDQEIVFTDRSILKASKATANVKNNDLKSAAIKSAAIAEYIKSDKKESLLESGALKNVPVSYSRGALTAFKLES